jgi:hypothetical protein
MYFMVGFSVRFGQGTLPWHDDVGEEEAVLTFRDKKIRDA